MNRAELLEQVVGEQHQGSPDELRADDPLWLSFRWKGFDGAHLIQLVIEADEQVPSGPPALRLVESA